MISHDVMRTLANDWAVNSNLEMRDHWLMTAELIERLDEIIALLKASHSVPGISVWSCPDCGSQHGWFKCKRCGWAPEGWEKHDGKTE